jgi:hypothetical protein
VEEDEGIVWLRTWRMTSFSSEARNVNIRQFLTRTALAAAVTVPLVVVGTATAASADTLLGFCNGFNPGMDCGGGASGTEGTVWVVNNPDYEWVFTLNCAWGGDQNSGPNPPSTGYVYSSLGCNLGAYPTGFTIQAL